MFISLKSFSNDNYSNKKESNPLINLNHALSDKGFSLEIKENYKFKKILVIYYLFTKDLDENILNSKNKIKIGKNSELHLLEYFVNDSKKNFFNNVHENIVLEKFAILKNIYLQSSKSSGYFHKYSKNKLFTGSNYTSFIFPAGLKFNKLDLEFNLEGERSEFNLQSASFLDNNEHQEIKTRVNHFSPNCKSHQKVKNVLNDGKRPVLAIVGGAKISTKISVIKNMISKFDNIIFVGGMANNIIKFNNYEIGKSIYEENCKNIISEIFDLCKKNNCKIFFPLDVKVGKNTKDKSTIKSISEISVDDMILDIGPKTVSLIKDIINNSNTILWNGPAGYFENPEFSKGSEEIAKKIIERKKIFNYRLKD